jgi:hypothetical protein
MRLAIPGMLILAFLFSTCQKDDDLMLLDDQQLELRDKKCTKTQTSTTISTAVPVDANNQQVEDAVRPQLETAIKNEKDPVVKAVLSSILVGLPGEAVIMSNFLSEPDVAGLTMPFFKYVYYKGKLVIVVINIQLLENPNLKAHEDGHAYIADEIAKKCSEKAAKDSGKDCKDAGDDVTNKLKELNKKAQDAYDKATNSGQKGNQAHEAKKAAKTIIDEYLKGK